MQFSLKLSEPFDLSTTIEYFGGWLPFRPDPSAIAMAFPLEDWQTSVAVVINQPDKDTISGEVFNAAGSLEAAQAENAWHQALATLSLDSPGTAWREVGETDKVIGKLQQQFNYLRPVTFYSPYEAACSFIIGHRISIAQTRAMRRKLAAEFGDQIPVAGDTHFAFPRPQVLLAHNTLLTIRPEKVERLHGIARAALDGRLDRDRLRSMPVDEALADLRKLEGVGPFFAQGILLRGAGLEDEISDDEITKQAVQLAYNLPAEPTHREVERIAQNWVPYRTWTNVLLHNWYRRTAGPRYRPEGRSGKSDRNRTNPERRWGE